jgi:hypothetical protein
VELFRQKKLLQQLSTKRKDHPRPEGSTRPKKRAKTAQTAPVTATKVVQGQISISLPSIKSSLAPPPPAEPKQAALSTPIAPKAAVRKPRQQNKPAVQAIDPNVERLSLQTFLKIQGADAAAPPAATTKKAAKPRSKTQGVIAFKRKKANPTADGSPAKSTRSKKVPKGKDPKKPAPES